MLRVGGIRVAYDQAERWVKAYLLEGGNESAYPAYDGYEGSGTHNPVLGEADLLAPVLLNVANHPVPTFNTLKQLMPRLNVELTRVSRQALLDEADQDQLKAVAAAFSALDSVPKPHRVGLTTLSKVLARKRAGLIPVYDKYVKECYTLCAGAPVPIQPGRSWEAYVFAWIRAVQTDLTAEDQSPIWRHLASLTPQGSVPISPLRALDIVAWRAGQMERRRRAAVS